MFTNENIIRYTNINPNLKINDKPVVNKQKISKCITNIFIPRQKDVLFWCFYIILNGKEKYLFNINNTFTTEKETKIAAIEMLKSKKDIMKEHKLRKTEIENELLNEKTITIKGLSGLCIAFDISLCVVKNRLVFDLNYSDKINGIICYENDKYGVYDDDNINDFYKNIKENYYIANPSKPIKAVSGYTIKELQDMSKKLNIIIIDKNGMKLKKNDIYERIKTIL
tara:strand:- start:100 stop:774 length:675 start_codon:yes stop_codon:yes gene_type:complete